MMFLNHFLSFRNCQITQFLLLSIYINTVSRAVASVRQVWQMPPLNFGPEIQYFNEFLKKDYMLFVFIVIQNEKVFFL